MKYTPMFSESLRNPPCRSDKYGKKGALQEFEVYSGSKTTSHHMLANEARQGRAGLIEPHYSKDDSVRVQRHLNNQQERDRERRSSLYDGGRNTEYYPKNYPVEPYISNTATLPLHELDNRPKAYRNSTIGGGRQKYNRNFESKYAQEYQGKTGYEARTSNAYEGKPTYEPRASGYDGGNKPNLSYETKVSSAYDPARRTQAYTKENNEQRSYEPTHLERPSRTTDRSYEYQPTTVSIIHREPTRQQPNNYLEPAYDGTVGKDLLRNLDKVQQKIRSLLNQK